ncbi:TPR-like protein [Byssothecium circinans]|uniref:TPR-like protein n=1 Tax=Byssothecium circinans TaxID=147558 RepID=A0A6A5TZT0_9PLEO|nr:TPR-like protein [Byssothecium circinans]
MTEQSQGPANSSEHVALPCNTLPFQRNRAFYGRSAILDELSGALRPTDDEPRVRSVGLHGAGGISKSQIALEYADLEVRRGTQVVLWIGSETDAEVSKSFTEAASSLKLRDYSPNNTPDQNKIAVLRYLQNTSTFWLVIFDNVEFEDTLTQNWPRTGNGSILVTCRSEFLVDSQVDVPIEVPTFTSDEGSELMMQIIGRNNPTQDERIAAVELSDRLGGLALGVDIVAKQIRTSKRFKSVKDFLPHFYEDRCELLKKPKRSGFNIYYSKDLDTIWNTAFVSLEEASQSTAARLLSLLCYLAPEGIPQWVLETKEQVPEEWQFFGSVTKFEEASDRLRDLSLIRINDETGFLAIHRLIQEAYFDRMDAEQKADAFKTALKLLRAAFPGRTGHNHLYTRWQVCEQLRQHILAFQSQHEQLKEQGFFSQDEAFIRLICDCAWYLLEIQSFQDCEKTLQKADANCEDKNSLAYAYLCCNLVSLYERTGRSPKAVEHALRSLKIREPLSKDNDKNDLANAYSDLGYSSVSNYEAKEAIKYFGKAIEIAKADNNPEFYKTFNIDRFLRNRGRAWMLLGDIEEAVKDFDEAEDYQTKIHGPGSHYHGEVTYERAKIAAREGNDKEAYSLLEKAYQLVSKGKPTHSSVMAVRYQQACACIRMGNDNQAEKHLNEALAICQLNELQRGNKGESARVKWRLSQIMTRRGLMEDAKMLRDDAEETRKALEQTGDYASGQTGDSAWDVFMGLLYR